MEKRVLFFKVGRQLYGLDLIRTQGIENLDHFTPIMNISPHVKGLMTLRGDILPVYSLPSKFGVEQKPFGSHTQVIIGKLRDGMLISFIMDEVREIIEVDVQNFSAPPELIKSNATGYVESVVPNKGVLAVMLSLDNLVEPQEREVLKKLVDDAKKKEQEKKEEALQRELEERRRKEQEEKEKQEKERQEKEQQEL